MNRVLELRRKKAGLVERATAIRDAVAEGELMSAEQRTEFDGLMGQAEELVGGSSVRSVWRCTATRISLRMLLSAAWRRSIVARRRTRKRASIAATCARVTWGRWRSCSSVRRMTRP